MRRELFVVLLLVTVVMPGCFSVYDISPGAIVQYNAPTVPPHVAGEEVALTPPMMGADAAEPGTSQAGSGNQQNTVYIGGRNAPATDLEAALDITATIRDLIANPGP